MNLAQVELKAKIIDASPEALVSELVLERMPFIFKQDWNEFRTWRRILAIKIDVDPCDIFIVGSAALGFSLNPYKNLRKYDNYSDIDLAVVSSHHFDLAWRAIVSRKKLNVTTQMWDSIESHRRNYVYSGCIACDYIMALMPFANKWTTAMQDMSYIAPTEDRLIKVRIYRDVGSLRKYQIQTIEKIKSELKS